VLGYELHYREAGHGETVMVLLHGFGGNIYTWRKVMEPLAEHGRVIAFDRIGTGLSAHPMPGDWMGESPYAPSMQPKFVVGLMNALGIEHAILIGNSQGGTVSLQTAVDYPKRISALVLADPAVYTAGGPPTWLGWLWATPQMRRIGPFASRQFLSPANADKLLPLVWHDPSRYTTEERAAAARFFRVRNWDRSLWEYTVANEKSVLAGQVADLNLPSLVVAGDDDRIVPTAEHVRLSKVLPNARLVVIEGCGHVPQEEKPEEFLRAVIPFLMSFQTQGHD
jgi:pimeloyl-ACP methyl ester carboxylesterase